MKNKTTLVVREAMKAVSKDVRSPKIVRSLQTVKCKHGGKYTTTRNHLGQDICDKCHGQVTREISNIEKLFIPYGLAVILKGKGFDDECIAYYNHRRELLFMTMGLTNSDAKQSLPNGNITAPLYQQVIDWFRRKHNVYIEIEYSITELSNSSEIHFQNFINGDCPNERPFKTYYEAFNKAITESLKRI